MKTSHALCFLKVIICLVLFFIMPYFLTAVYVAYITTEEIKDVSTASVELDAIISGDKSSVINQFKDYDGQILPSATLISKLDNKIDKIIDKISRGDVFSKISLDSIVRYDILLKNNINFEVNYKTDDGNASSSIFSAILLCEFVKNTQVEQDKYYRLGESIKLNNNREILKNIEEKCVEFPSLTMQNTTNKILYVDSSSFKPQGTIKLLVIPDGVTFLIVYTLIFFGWMGALIMLKKGLEFLDKCKEFFW